MVQRFSRLGIGRRLLWAHPAFDASLADLGVTVYDENDDLIAVLPAIAVVSPLGLYWTAPYLAPAVGMYKLHWVSVLGGIDYTEELVVTTHPTGDEEATVPKKFLRVGAPAGVADGQLTVFDSAASPWGSSPYNVSETVVPGTYQTDSLITLDDEGQYILLWESTTTPTFNYMEVVYVGARRGLHDVRIHVINNGEVPYGPIDGCAVLASLPDGTPVDQQLTNIQGVAYFQLVEGMRYVISLRYANTTFTRNNMEIMPLDPDTEHIPAATNQFFFLTTWFLATFDPIARIDATKLSTMKVDVVDPTGRPIQGVPILVHYQGPSYVTDGGTDFFVSNSDGGIVVYTNANGHVELPLLRGIEALVTVEAADVRRYITVPDQMDFNLSSLITGTDDPFEIARPDIYDAPRRSL